MVRRPASYGAGLRTTLSAPLWSRFTAGLSAARNIWTRYFLFAKSVAS